MTPFSVCCCLHFRSVYSMPIHSLSEELLLGESTGCFSIPVDTNFTSMTAPLMVISTLMSFSNLTSLFTATLIECTYSASLASYITYSISKVGCNPLSGWAWLALAIIYNPTTSSPLSGFTRSFYDSNEDDPFYNVFSYLMKLLSSSPPSYLSVLSL